MQFFVVLEKFTCAYLFQIALEIIRLPIQIVLNHSAFQFIDSGTHTGASLLLEPKR